MRNTVRAYRIVCVAIALLGWIPVVFWLRPSTLLEGIQTFAPLLFGGYCTLELARLSTERWTKNIWRAALVPYMLLIGGSLFVALPYVPRLFAI